MAKQATDKRWPRADRIAAAGVVLAAISTWVAVATPEWRTFFGFHDAQPAAASAPKPAAAASFFSPTTLNVHAETGGVAVGVSNAPITIGAPISSSAPSAH